MTPGRADGQTAETAARALESARAALLARRASDGHWPVGSAARQAWVDPDPEQFREILTIAPEALVREPKLRALPYWAREFALRTAARQPEPKSLWDRIAMATGRRAAIARCEELLRECKSHEGKSAPDPVYDTAVASAALGEPSAWVRSHFAPGQHRTAEAALALLACPDHAAAREWLAANRTARGAWTAFGAGHDDAIDPPCAASTGWALEALAGGPGASAAVRYLVDAQELDGAWIAQWGGGQILGTFQALRGLRAAGEHTREAHMLRGGEWLRGVQNADGGWGSPSTATQTAWAVLGLLASGDDDSMSLRAGVEYLSKSGFEDGAAYPVLALQAYLRDHDKTRGDLA